MIKEPEPPDLWTEETPSGDLWIGRGHKRFRASIGMDEDLIGYLILWCPECARELRQPFSEVKPGEVSLCECAKFTFEFEEAEDLVPLRDALDSLRKTLEDIRKQLGG